MILLTLFAGHNNRYVQIPTNSLLLLSSLPPPPLTDPFPSFANLSLCSERIDLRSKIEACETVDGGFFLRIEEEEEEEEAKEKDMVRGVTMGNGWVWGDGGDLMSR
jgi:hypothetical protein